MSKGNNSGLSIIADRYAVALIELAEQNQQLDQFLSDLMQIKDILLQNRELTLFLEHPSIPLDEKKNIVDSIFRAHVTQYVLNFMKILLDKSKINILPFVVDHYIQILNKRKNITIAEVTTAIYISEETKNRLQLQLENVFGLNIDIILNVDTEIIAGMIVKIGDSVIDGSIKTKLENMKKQMI